MIQRTFFIGLLLFTFANAYTLQDAKKLKYMELTSENISLYKKVLESLQKQNNQHGMYMLASAYETGSHWDKDIDKAIEIYKILSTNNYKGSNLKLGTILINLNRYNEAKTYLTKAINHDKKKSLLYLLQISLYQKDIKEIQKYYDLSKENNIELDQFILEKIKNNNIDIKTIAQKMEDTTFEVSKEYIVMIFNTVKSSKAMLRNLGFKVDESSINYSSDPTVSILVKRTDDNIDNKMAQYLAQDNVLKQSIYNALSFVNKLEPYLKDEAKQELKWIRFEVGTSSNVKITTREIN
ncbi:MAG: hypothetical protein U9N59_15905 [Campylobacterota bacterium]|nr:hypothetical protein [Campylobacterota bacterium]